MIEAQKRFWQIRRLVDKESVYLQDVARWLPVITPEWIESLIASPEGRDRLEAFVGKFSRMQDTLIDKLLPHYLAAVGEKTGSALDNLNRADRLGLLDNPDQWLACVNYATAGSRIRRGSGRPRRHLEPSLRHGQPITGGRTNHSGFRGREISGERAGRTVRSRSRITAKKSGASDFCGGIWR